ncbi:MAG: sulfatase-like hydrolase/transferase [Planctomycetota bacterium]
MKPATPPASPPDPQVRDAAAPASASAQHHRAWLCALLAGYFAANLAGRWLRWSLYAGHGAYGWEAPSRATSILQTLMVCLPAAFWAYLVYVAAKRFPHVLRGGVLLTLAFLTLVAIEVDLSWYQMSHRHVGWADIELLLTEEWTPHFLKNHLGIRESDTSRTLYLFGVHAIALGGIGLLAAFASKKQWLARRPGQRRLGRGIGIALAAAVIIDSFLVASLTAGAHDTRNQWRALERANLLRIPWFDGIWTRFSALTADLNAANAAFVKSETPVPARPQPPNPAASARRIESIILVTAESLNVNQIDRDCMPFLHEFAKGGLQLTHHYSAGNCTHYGLLGLIYGEPVTFYRGRETDRPKGSAYIDRLTGAGFESRFIGADVTNHRHTAEYMANFTHPPTIAEDWEILEHANRVLEGPGKQFVMLFYNDTHYPYPHPDEYDAFQPEVPADFDYGAWNLREHKPGIINRYKNCALEFDAWLKRLVANLDLERTLLIITGDHGQEFFERGRLGHSSSLSEPQIRVPFVMVGPGVAPRTIEQVTSHNDVMPSLMDLLGVSMDDSPYGMSFFRSWPIRSATVAYNNHTNPVKRWAVVTEDAKCVLEGTDPADLRIARLADWADETVGFRAQPGRWTQNFGQAKRFMAFAGKR